VSRYLYNHTAGVFNRARDIASERTFTFAEAHAGPLGATATVQNGRVDVQPGISTELDAGASAGLGVVVSKPKEGETTGALTAAGGLGLQIGFAIPKNGRGRITSVAVVTGLSAKLTVSASVDLSTSSGTVNVSLSDAAPADATATGARKPEGAPAAGQSSLSNGPMQQSSATRPSRCVTAANERCN
jgi:hypothetical protein